MASASALMISGIMKSNSLGTTLHSGAAFGRTAGMVEIEILSEILGHLETPPECEGFPNFANAN